MSAYQAPRLQPDGTGQAAPHGAPIVGRLSTAVVIGVGGSGIQTVSRLKSRIYGSRVDAQATPSISFLGIDAVPQNRQEPPLPDGVELSPVEFYNVTEVAFDAGLFLQHRGDDPEITSWWDRARTVPKGPLTDGLMADRMLGRLAFYQRGAEVADKVTSAVRSAIEINRQRMAAGHGGQGQAITAPKIYVVGSSCGGTGSAALLEVLYCIWSATAAQAMVPDITVFTYLPGVFEPAISSASHSRVEENSNLRANAYAFFRELDHFIQNSSQLSSAISHSNQLLDPQLDDGALVKQVFLMDSMVPGVGVITEIGDIYEMTAEAMFQFLMTDAGDRTMSVNAANNPVLGQLDGHRKRRIYCGLLVGSALYPGDTIRFHLANRFYEYWLRETLLRRPYDLPEVVAGSESNLALRNMIDGLDHELRESKVPQALNLVISAASDAPQTLSADWSTDAAFNVVGHIKADLGEGLNQYSRDLIQKRRSLVAKAERIIIESALDAAESVGFCEELLRSVGRHVSDQRRDLESALAAVQLEVGQWPGRIDSALSALAAVGGRWWANVPLLSSRMRADAEQLGHGLRRWVEDEVLVVKLREQTALAKALMQTLGRLEARLGKSQRALESMAEQASRNWHQDSLLGKDRNPPAVTAFVPSDIMPQVEGCRLNLDIFAEVTKRLDDRRSDFAPMMTRLYTNWRNRAPEALFALGSRVQDQVQNSEAALVDELAELAEELVLERGKVGEEDGDHRRYLVPRSLEEAAKLVDGGTSLEKALASLQGVSNTVALPLQTEKMKVNVPPSATTIVVRPATLQEQIDHRFPATASQLSIVDGVDPEKVVTLNMLWGASMHAVSVVAQWEADYRRLLQRMGEDNGQKRMHLHCDWLTLEGPLTQLVPVYFDPQLAASAFVGLELASQLLEVDGARANLLSDKPVVADLRPLWTEQIEGRHVWSATRYARSADSTKGWVSRSSTALGDSLPQVLEQIAKDAALRQFVPGLVGDLIDFAGFDATIAALESLAARYQQMVELYEPRSKDGEAARRIVHDIKDRVRDLRIQQAHGS